MIKTREKAMAADKSHQPPDRTPSAQPPRRTDHLHRMPSSQNSAEKAVADLVSTGKSFNTSLEELHAATAELIKQMDLSALKVKEMLKERNLDSPKEIAEIQADVARNIATLEAIQNSSPYQVFSRSSNAEATNPILEKFTDHVDEDACIQALDNAIIFLHKHQSQFDFSRQIAPQILKRRDLLEKQFHGEAETLIYFIAKNGRFRLELEKAIARIYNSEELKNEIANKSQIAPDEGHTHSSDLQPKTILAVTEDHVRSALTKIGHDPNDAPELLRQLHAASIFTPPPPPAKKGGRQPLSPDELAERAMRPGPQFKKMRERTKNKLRSMGYDTDQLPLLVKISQGPLKQGPS